MGGGDNKATALRGVAALNIYKKVAIIRSSSDVLSYEDADGKVKTVTDLHLAAAETTPVLKTKKKDDIPVPTIRTVETYKTDIPPNYECPTSYVRNRRPTQQELLDNIEYVIDAEDEVWLINNSKIGGQSQNQSQSQQPTTSQQKKRKAEQPNDKDDSATTTTTTTTTNNNNNTNTTPTTFPLPLAMLETMMDVMEKATAFEAIITIDQAEELILKKLPQLYHMYPIKARAGVVTIKHVLTDVYNYWVSKRSKLKRPLLRRFWPVTSSDDTNPHLVFRPREKEKYKLRKKRQNDMDAHRKLTQLKQDFEHVRAVLKFVKQREELNRTLVYVQKEWFQQKIHDATDTSGLPRVATSMIAKDKVQELVKVPQIFDVQGGSWKKGKKARRGSSQGSTAGGGGASGRTSQNASPVPPEAAAGATAEAPAAATEPLPLVVAGQNHGEPAPNFLHPLSTREAFATSWDTAVPNVTTFTNATPEPTYHFRHRPRVGRGGRLNIDRMPIQIDPNMPPTTVFRATTSQAFDNKPKRRLLDLLPTPLDREAISRRIEDICLTSLKEDYDRQSGGAGGVPGAPPGTAAAATGVDMSGGDDADGDVVLVNSDDWLNTDDQLWGEERYSIGPI